LRDIATDPNEPADETNPLRQVVINTHSPSVVMAVPGESMLSAKTASKMKDGRECSVLAFECLPSSWRSKPPSNCPQVSRGTLLSYLNPAGALPENSESVKEQMEFNLGISSQS